MHCQQEDIVESGFYKLPLLGGFRGRVLSSQELSKVYELTEKDRVVLSNFIEKHYGIQMPPTKKILLQSRLQKRALHLRYNSIREYMDFLFSSQGQQLELGHFAAIISTHKTDFYRENEHFTALRSLLLPELLENSDIGKNETLVAWSSASSTGEEVYSIAITIYDFFKTHGSYLPMFKVIGTDISEDIVEIARKGIYSDQALFTIPVEYRHYLMRSKDRKQHAIRVVPEIRAFTDFRQQNLMDKLYRVTKGIHIIFCRNVLIYFDKSTQENILRKLVSFLVPGGFLLIGHSESISGMDLPVEPVQLTVYRKVKE
jgi:chemotaxis protein methyltransferase CheR